MMDFNFQQKAEADSTGVIRKKPQGGGVFIHLFQLSLAQIKTPPPWGFSRVFSFGWVEHSLLSEILSKKIPEKRRTLS